MKTFKEIREEVPNYKVELLKKGYKSAFETVPSDEKGLLRTLPEISGKIGWPWTEEQDPGYYINRSEWPKITIVTPSYNQGQFIEETIRSILLQNYPNLEYIVIDGGSNDNTVEIIKKYSPWITYWISEKDNGQSQAINKGFSIASGDYFAWINSDDYYQRFTFFEVFNHFKKNTKLDFIYGDGLSIKEGTTIFKEERVFHLFDRYIRFPTLFQPSCFWRSRVHQPLWEDLHCALDYELWCRMIKGVRRKKISLPLSIARQHENAKTFSEKMKQAWEKDHQLICHQSEHGSVENWDYLEIERRIVFKLLNIFKY